MNPLDGLRDVVAPALLERASEVSERPNDLGVPHTLIGGLAVGVHGHPPATKDIDFLVGSEAFDRMTPLLVYRDELRELVRIGTTDLMSVPPGRTGLADELALTEDIPVISLAGPVLLKLDAYRPQDREDVRVLLSKHRDRVRHIRDHLATHAPDLVPRLAEMLSSAK